MKNSACQWLAFFKPNYVQWFLSECTAWQPLLVSKIEASNLKEVKGKCPRLQQENALGHQDRQG